MRPDIKREQRNGWLVLGAAGLVCLATVGWYASDDGLEAQVDAAATKHKSLLGKELMSVHVKRQTEANAVLNDSIEELKRGTSFAMAPFFVISGTDAQNGQHVNEIWLREKQSKVVDELDGRAHDFGLKGWDRYTSLDFSADGLPNDSEVPYLSVILQLTYRTAMICFSSPPAAGADHIHTLHITHEKKPRKPVGPVGRPPLLKEYPLTVEVHASLAEVMWILYRFSDTKAYSDLPLDPGTYPLILESLHIHCNPNAEEEVGDPIYGALDVDATFEVAALEYVDASKRGGATVAPVRPAPGAAAIPTDAEPIPTAGSGFHARP